MQYHSYLRSTHTSVQGERGEVFDDTLRCLDAAGEPVWWEDEKVFSTHSMER